MAQIKFTEEEMGHILLVSKSLQKTRTNLTEKDWRKGEHKTVRAFIKKFAEGDHTREYILDRNALRLLEQVCAAGIMAMEQNIIPSYEKRVTEEPDKKEYYQPYIDKAVATIAAYLDIKQKVEKAL